MSSGKDCSSHSLSAVHKARRAGPLKPDAFSVCAALVLEVNLYAL